MFVNAPVITMTLLGDDPAAILLLQSQLQNTGLMFVNASVITMTLLGDDPAVILLLQSQLHLSIRPTNGHLR